MNKKDAILFARISHGVYINQFKLPDFKHTANFENTGTNTQGVFGIANQKRFVVAFRGSEETKVDDWITDLKFIKQVFPYQESNNSKVKVHFGFIGAYKSVREAVLKTVETSGVDTVVFTGHSLGAALATLAALDIQYNLPNLNISCFTYGSPKVGNKHFAESYNRRVPKTYRIVNRFDIIPKLPPFGYQHVGQLHHLASDSTDHALASNMIDHLPHNYVQSLNV